MRPVHDLDSQPSVFHEMVRVVVVDLQKQGPDLFVGKGIDQLVVVDADVSQFEVSFWRVNPALDESRI